MKSPFVNPGAGRLSAAPALGAISRPVRPQTHVFTGETGDMRKPSAPVSPLPQLRADPSEIDDLRKSPVYKAPADPSAYSAAPVRDKRTAGLHIGTQARFIAAAKVAASLGFPLNALLTLRWMSLFSNGDVNWLRALPVPERIDKLVERLRKWLGARGVPPC